MLDLALVEARTVATTVLVLVGLYLIIALEASTRLRGAAVTMLCAGLIGLYAVILAVPGTRDFFELAVPGPAAWATVLCGTGLGIAGLWLTDERFVPGGEARVAGAEAPGHDG